MQKKEFYYDQNKANHAIDWIETHCFHTEGPLAPQPIKLEVWQKAKTAAIYGIVDENGQKVINITNPSQFWSHSNYLIIEID